MPIASSFRGKALTVIQPWASAIAFAGKDVENRTWRTHYRGPLAIHAGLDKRYVEDGLSRRHCDRRGRLRPLAELIAAGQRRWRQMDRGEEPILGHIVAVAALVDCVDSYESQWYDPEQWGFVLEDVIPIQPVPMLGKRQLWDCRFNYRPLERVRR
jgi:hypothetical protein